jgi:hypothetical protein
MASHSGPVNLVASASMNARVRAGISRRPGNTAQQLTGGIRQSGITCTRVPASMLGIAK